MSEHRKADDLRWRELWTRVARSDAGAEYGKLVAAYAESHRAYHTLEHVRACLVELDRCREAATDCDAVEVALWYHDVVYDPYSSRNEAASAEEAARALTEGEADDGFVRTVAALVRATQHTALPQSRDEALIIDVDLSILGAEPEVYRRYTEAVRREYALVPEAVFRDRRAALLSAFLARERLFRTDALHARYEVRARANLEAEHDDLCADP